jgi:DNA helicase TIP49 (TBP-interacting protein)
VIMASNRGITTIRGTNYQVLYHDTAQYNAP